MKWFFIKSDPTICTSSPKTTPLLMGINMNNQMDRDLEEWQPLEIIKLQNGIEKKLTLEQLAVGHNRSLKNIEAKLKSMVTEYYDSKEHDLESIKLLTGLSEEIIVDTISRHEFKKSRYNEQEQKEKKDYKEQKDHKDHKEQKTPKNNETEILFLLKDIHAMLRYLIEKNG
jgi:hypothetical protein